MMKYNFFRQNYEGELNVRGIKDKWKRMEYRRSCRNNNNKLSLSLSQRLYEVKSWKRHFGSRCGCVYHYNDLDHQVFHPPVLVEEDPLVWCSLRLPGTHGEEWEGKCCTISGITSKVEFQVSPLASFLPYGLYQSPAHPDYYSFSLFVSVCVCN